MLELISKLKSELAKASVTKKFWLYLAIAGVGIASAVIFLAKDYFNKKAKLSVAQTKDDIADAKYKANVDVLAKDKVKLQTAVQRRDEVLVTTTKAIESAHKAAKNDKEVIDSISSWDDVDSKTRR